MSRLRPVSSTTPSRSRHAGVDGGYAVGLVVAALALIAASAYAAGTAAPPVGHTPVRLPWPLLLVFFAVTQIAPLHLTTGKQTQSISLTELPFVLGLLFVPAPWFVVSRVVGSIAVEAAVRRQYRHPLKLLFNVSLFSAEAVTGTQLFRLLDHGTPAVDVRAWWAAGATAALASVISGMAVAALIQLMNRRLDRPALAGSLRRAVLHALAVTTLGVDAALVLLDSKWAVVPLVVTVLVMFATYRSYASLRERHQHLEALQDFARAMSVMDDEGVAVEALLKRARSALHASTSRLVLCGTEGTASRELAVEGAVAAQVSEPWLDETAGWMLAHARSGNSLLVRRDTRELAPRQWLDRHGLRDAALAPMRIGNDVDAVLVVADRLGEAHGFEDRELRLLETMAVQAAVELRSCRLVDRLRHAALHDTVTGLPNRAYLEQVLEERTPMRDGDILALGMLTFESFQEVNDSFGHRWGDELMREVGRRVVDTVGEHASVYRFGDGQLAVIADHGGSLPAVNQMFRRVLDGLAEPVTIDDTVIDVGPRAGLALAPLHADSAQDLLRCADVAASAARTTADDLVMYEHVIDATRGSRLALAAALRQAINLERIAVFVQPKLALDTGDVTSVEALARWHDPVNGPVSPMDFIPVAEQTGLIRQLTELVLDQSLAACAAWQQQAPGVGVAVNLSARMLHHTDLEALVMRALRRHRVDVALLTLEITESGIMTDPEHTRMTMQRLRDRGLGVSIDDFGTGYSSLAYLHRLPVNEVKIDRSFVMRMASNPADTAIVRAVVDLAHNLGLTVVAEGVEDEASHHALIAVGCDLAQGFLFARPMPVESFGAWLEARRTVPQPAAAASLALPGERRPW